MKCVPFGLAPVKKEGGGVVFDPGPGPLTRSEWKRMQNRFAMVRGGWRGKHPVWSSK